ncbi:MAG TPA: 3-oxoacyl-ACP reductase family protein [Chitinophagaceae bacterium]|jgi:3-oxoacyl-[acyl-carrier protein] reductase|nr:3-oxoacyl-ACP reductase family protein [Chitinophagaceae bacterium]
MRLKDQVAIVTGAARGIGQAFSIALAHEGARVVAADILPCSDTVNKILEFGGEAIDIATDVSKSHSTQALVENAVKQFGRVDILVNNAAMIAALKLTPFDQIPEEEWDQVMAVNIKGMWLCCKAVVPHMKQQGKGKIINISSDTIWLGVPMLLHYVSSKGAILSFTRSLARELSGTNINVNAITPGFTQTDATRGLADPDTMGYIQAASLNQQIIKRPEEPSDLTGALIFLASGESDFITGQTINVNGGATHH